MKFEGEHGGAGAGRDGTIVTTKAYVTNAGPDGALDLFLPKGLGDASESPHLVHFPLQGGGSHRIQTDAAGSDNSDYNDGNAQATSASNDRPLHEL